MAAIPQPTTVDPPAHMISPGPVNPTAHLAQALPGFDPEAVINAHEANLAEYLNQPVQDILSRLGLPRTPDATPPPGAPNAETPAGAANPIDPSQMIQPVTDALGTLGSGQFNNADPTQMFQGISQALESAAQPVQQALSGLDSLWQGASASAAGAKTTATLADGAEVAGQATSLGDSLSTAVASVKQAEIRLIAIINEFWAKIAAIGPNIIFPWGIAAAIQAATEAVTETTEVISDTQATLGTQAAQVATAGTPVSVTAAPELSAQSLAPLMQMATGLAQPAMEGVSAVTQVAQAGAGATPASAAASAAGGPVADGAAAAAPLSKAAGGVGGSAGSAASGAGSVAPRLGSPLLPRSASVPATDAVSATTEGSAVKPAASGMGGGPMAGGSPMGNAGKSGADGRHNAAAFLHTSNDQIVGDLGNAAPPVIGHSDPTERPDIDLRI
jgi:hypothetical protein